MVDKVLCPFCGALKWERSYTHWISWDGLHLVINMVIHGICPVFMSLGIFLIFPCLICLNCNHVFLFSLKNHMILIGVWSMESSRRPWKTSPQWHMWNQNTIILNMEWKSESKIWTILSGLLYLIMKWTSDSIW